MPEESEARSVSDSLKLSNFKTYAELRKFADEHPETTPVENLVILERMRQLRHGYEPGSLRMDKSKIEFKFYTMAEFRELTEREYAEEIKKYGPR